MSIHTIGQALRSGSLELLDAQGLPLILNWCVVHWRNKRLPPVAQSFKDFLLAEGAAWIARTTTSGAE